MLKRKEHHRKWWRFPRYQINHLCNGNCCGDNFEIVIGLSNSRIVRFFPRRMTPKYPEIFGWFYSFEWLWRTHFFCQITIYSMHHEASLTCCLKNLQKSPLRHNLCHEVLKGHLLTKWTTTSKMDHYQHLDHNFWVQTKQHPVLEMDHVGCLKLPTGSWSPIN